MRLARALILLFILAVAALMLLVIADRAHLITLPRQYDPFALPDLDARPGWLTSTQLKLIDADPRNCSIALARTGLAAPLLSSRGVGSSCEVERPVLLTRLSRATIRPEQTRCNVAARLYMWEKHVIQPAARRIFGEPVVEITHFGSFSCRTIAGSTWMSEHARANAFDISGFKLKNGKKISLLTDWKTPSLASAFLHDVRDGACNYFNLTLSPDYNAAHHDHFHVDMGWLRGCH